MRPSPQKRERILVISSRQDRPFAEELRAHPTVRDWQSTLDLWDDAQIEHHPYWREELAALIASARAVLLFASPALVAKAPFSQNILPPLLHAAQQEGAIIYWVVIDF